MPYPVRPGERSVQHPFVGQPLADNQLSCQVTVKGFVVICHVLVRKEFMAAVVVVTRGLVLTGYIIVILGLECSVDIHFPDPILMMSSLVEKLDSSGEVRNKFFLVRESEFIKERGIVIWIKLVQGFDRCRVIRIDVVVPQPEIRIVAISQLPCIPIISIQFIRSNSAVTVEVLPEQIDFGRGQGVDEIGDVVSGLRPVSGDRQFDDILPVAEQVVSQTESWGNDIPGDPGIKLIQAHCRQELRNQNVGRDLDIFYFR